MTKKYPKQKGLKVREPREKGLEMSKDNCFEYIPKQNDGAIAALGFCLFENNFGKGLPDIGLASGSGIGKSFTLDRIGILINEPNLLNLDFVETKELTEEEKEKRDKELKERKQQKNYIDTETEEGRKEYKKSEEEDVKAPIQFYCENFLYLFQKIQHKIFSTNITFNFHTTYDVKNKTTKYVIIQLAIRLLFFFYFNDKNHWREFENHFYPIFDKIEEDYELVENTNQSNLIANILLSFFLHLQKKTGLEEIELVLGIDESIRTGRIDLVKSVLKNCAYQIYEQTNGKLKLSNIFVVFLPQQISVWTPSDNPLLIANATILTFNDLIYLFKKGGFQITPLLSCLLKNVEGNNRAASILFLFLKKNQHFLDLPSEICENQTTTPKGNSNTCKTMKEKIKKCMEHVSSQLWNDEETLSWKLFAPLITGEEITLSSSPFPHSPKYEMMIQNGIYTNSLFNETIPKIYPQSSLFWFHCFSFHLKKLALKRDWEVETEINKVLKDFGKKMEHFLQTVSTNDEGAEFISSFILYSKLLFYHLYSLELNKLKEPLKRKEYADQHSIVIINDQFYVSLSSLFNQDLCYNPSNPHSSLKDVLISLSSPFSFSPSPNSRQKSLKSLKEGDVILFGNNNKGHDSGVLLSALLPTVKKGNYKKENIFVGMEDKPKKTPSSCDEVEKKFNDFEKNVNKLSKNTSTNIGLKILFWVANYDPITLPPPPSSSNSYKDKVEPNSPKRKSPSSPPTPSSPSNKSLKKIPNDYPNSKRISNTRSPKKSFRKNLFINNNNIKNNNKLESIEDYVSETNQSFDSKSKICDISVEYLPMGVYFLKNPAVGLNPSLSYHKIFTKDQIN